MESQPLQKVNRNLKSLLECFCCFSFLVYNSLARTHTACSSMGTLMISALLATKTMEDISEASGNGLRWLQIYMYRDRQLVTDCVRRAELAGYKAIVVTIDSPAIIRFNALRDVFKLPSHLGFANFRGATVASNLSLNDPAKLTVSLHNLFDPSLCWDDIRWLCSITHLPIVVKGVLTAEDAELAVESGVAGILVSNHGGRVLNTAVATVSYLVVGVSFNSHSLSFPLSLSV